MIASAIFSYDVIRRNAVRCVRPAHTVLITWTALMCVSMQARAQEVPQIPRDARLRVTTIDSRSEPISGVLGRTSRDSIVIVPRSADGVALAMSDIARIERSRGVHGRAGRGALIGTLGGAAALGLITFNACNAPEEPCSAESDHTGLVTVAGSLLGAAGGAILGGIVGALWRTERWVPFWDRTAAVRR